MSAAVTDAGGSCPRGRGFRHPLGTLLLAGVLWIAGHTPGKTDVPLPPGLKIPIGLYRICPSLEAAQAQAKLNERAGHDLKESDIKEGGLKAYVHRDCINDYVNLEILKTESHISSYKTWTLTYEKDSSDYVPKEDPVTREEVDRISVRIQKRWVRFYYTEMVTGLGEVFYGWAELSSEPYSWMYGRTHQNR